MADPTLELKRAKPLIIVHREQSQDNVTVTLNWNIVVQADTMKETFEYYKKVAEHEREHEIPFHSRLKEK